MWLFQEPLIIDLVANYTRKGGDSRAGMPLRTGEHLNTGRAGCERRRSPRKLAALLMLLCNVTPLLPLLLPWVGV
jgi:hypothetical protein